MTITAPTPTSKPITDFSPKQFYLLCNWVQAQDLKKLPSFDALVMVVSQHFAMPASEHTVKEALKITETVEPAHWSPPTEPALIVAYELAAFMKTLGAEPPASIKLLLAPKVAA